MRKLFWQEMVSLDGFMEGPNHELDWHVTDEDFARYVAAMEQEIDAMLFGRVTYQLMASYWPTATDPEARMMNELPKVVCSRTLTHADWNNTRLVRHNVADEVQRLKQQPGKDIAIFGSADLASSLLRWGLIDEVRLFVNPVLLGSGSPVFKNVEGRRTLKLLNTQTWRSGVVILTYQPIGSPSASQ